jgi:hypothetical protein
VTFVLIVNNHRLKPVALPDQALPVAYGDDFHPVSTGGIKIGRINRSSLGIL